MVSGRLLLTSGVVPPDAIPVRGTYDLKWLDMSILEKLDSWGGDKDSFRSWYTGLKKRHRTNVDNHLIYRAQVNNDYGAMKAFDIVCDLLGQNFNLTKRLIICVSQAVIEDRYLLDEVKTRARKLIWGLDSNNQLRIRSMPTGFR